MAKETKKTKELSKGAMKATATPKPKAAPAPRAIDDALLAYAMALGSDFDLAETAAQGFKKKDRYKQNLTSGGAHYIARQWPAKTLKVKTLNDTKSRWTLTNPATGDAVEFVSNPPKAVKAKMADTEAYRAWQEPLFPPVVMAGVRMDVVRDERAAGEVKNRTETHAFPPAKGTPAAKAFEAAQRSKYILRKTPVGKYGQWSEWKIVELKTFAKCLKDSSLAVFEYAEGPDERFDNDGSMGDEIAFAVFCAASDPKNAPVVSFMFAGKKE